MGLQEAGIIVSMALGLFGTVLGILNFRHQRNLTQPRLLVEPRIMTLIGETFTGERTTEPDKGVVQIKNVGHIPVKGSSIGVLGKRGHKDGLVVRPQVLGTDWPDLRPGKAVMLGFNLEQFLAENDVDRVSAFVVQTVIGDTFRSRRGAMRRFRESGRAYRQRQRDATQ